METILLILVGEVLILGALWAWYRYASFTSQSPEHYRSGRSGQFDLRMHLNGPIQCEGVIYGPLGRVTSRFVADFDASWDGDSGVMDEVFHYDDGTQQVRKWNLSLGSHGRITAEADDLVGQGSGEQSGDSVQLKYKIRLPDSSGGHVLDVVDWMYLTPNGVIMNRSRFRKFGIPVAELVATMRPKPAVELKEAA